MKIIPAIDLLGGQAVRLRRGVRADVTVFSDEPWQLVEQFCSAGAERIHVVDLDGAFSGRREHSTAVAKILEHATVPVQVGGGIRNRHAVESLLDNGVAFAVLGTAAVKDQDFARQVCRDYPGQIIIAVDAKAGQVAVEGWVETSELTAVELGKQAAQWGAAGLLYTDVARDGLNSGPNIAATTALAAATSVPVIASGGVSSLDDLRRLAMANIPYAIVGRALYDKRFTLQEALAVC